MNLDQTALKRAVWSGFIFFAIKPFKVHKQMVEQTTAVLNGEESVELLTNMLNVVSEQMLMDENDSTWRLMGLCGRDVFWERRVTVEDGHYWGVWVKYWFTHEEWQWHFNRFFVSHCFHTHCVTHKVRSTLVWVKVWVKTHWHMQEWVCQTILGISAALIRSYVRGSP